MPNRRSVTLKSVAAAAGVSLATAGRAMGDGGNISQKTIEHVRDVAGKLGYVRNLQGVKLRTGQSFSLVAVLRVSNDEEIGDAGASGLLAGLHTRVADTDYAVSLAPLADSDDENALLDRLSRLVDRGGFDGMILDHTRPNDPRAALLASKGVDFVTFGRTDRNDHPWFDIDDAQAYWQMTNRMIELGHRRIAYIGGPPQYRFIGEQLKGYQRALQEADIRIDPALITHAQLDPKSAKEALLSLPAQDFDAVLTPADITFFGVRAAARALGRDVRKDLVFGMRSSVDLGAYLDARIIRAQSSRIRTGQQLADQLIRYLAGEPVENLQVLEQVKIIETDIEPR